MKLSDHQKALIVHYHLKGQSGRQIAKGMGLSKSAINNHIADFRSQYPVITFLDVESAPSVAAVHKRFNVNITPQHIITEGGWLISASYSRMGEDKIRSVCVTPQEAKEGNDYRVCEELHAEISGSDIVVAHHGDGFDIPLSRARMVKNGLPPLGPIRSRDTLKMARQMKFESNKLDSLAHYLGIGRKIPTTGISLWIKCLEGDTKALKTMVEYNKHDIYLLKGVHDQLLPHTTGGINIGMYFDDEHEHCPACGSIHLSPADMHYTNLNMYQNMICNTCGHVSRIRQGVAHKAQRLKQLAH